MARYASGKNAYFISDRSGFRYAYKDMRREWNGAIVGPDEYEPKHPQLGPFRSVNDAQALKDARPDVPEVFTISITGINISTSLASVSVNGELAASSSTGSLTTSSALGSIAVYQLFAVTVVDDGGNKYYLDGSNQTGSAITLTEGSTYRFDQSHSSNSGHPLRFSETANGTHGGGTEYTTGVTTAGTPGSAGAYTQIKVAVGAPTLYYYCTNHSAMGWQGNTP